MKKCRGCHEYKDRSEFDVRRYHGGVVGLKSKCKICRKDERVKRRARDPHENNKNKEYNRIHAEEIRGKKLVKNYWPNLTWQEAIAEWNRIFQAQGGHCAVCLETKRLHVDHIHGTFIVRGLLCYNHNSGIGRFQDNPDTLRLAAEYLEKSKK